MRTHAQIEVIAEALRAPASPTGPGRAALLDRPAVRAALDLLRRPRPADGLPADLGWPSGADDAPTATTRRRERPQAAAATPRSSASPRATTTCASTRGAADSGFGLAGGHAAVRGRGRRRATPSTLATFHAAKGLEWPIVHLAGLEDGFVPIAHARTPAGARRRRGCSTWR